MFLRDLENDLSRNEIFTAVSSMQCSYRKAPTRRLPGSLLQTGHRILEINKLTDSGGVTWKILSDMQKKGDSLEHVISAVFFIVLKSVQCDIALNTFFHIEKCQSGGACLY